jgi:ABC-2 type transport system ATP-binding protein
MSTIEVRSVGFRYAEREALRGVSFVVKQGQIYSLLGPNGGGKTTLFRILSTLLKPSTGTAAIGGWDVVQEPFQARRSTGIVFQSSSLDLQLTALENLRYQGYLYGLKGSMLQERIEGILSRFGLKDRQNELLKRYSGGLLRRVELARALLHQPQFLLLDEPTAGLDPTMSREFWEYLESLREQDGMTVLLTTHLLNEAERCDQVAILNEGRIVSSGSPDELKSKVGSEIVEIQTSEPEQLAEILQESFGVDTLVLGSSIRIHQPNGHLLVAKIVERHAGRVDAVTFSKPTLEDVFIHETGHRFFNHELAEEAG